MNTSSATKTLINDPEKNAKKALNIFSPVPFLVELPQKILIRSGILGTFKPGY
jgi:hypothetical protein